MKLLTGFICLAALSGLGCASPSDAEEDDAPKPHVVFEGDVPDRFAGTWKTEDGKSTYQLKRDGSYVLDSKVNVPGRVPIDSHLEGEWRVKGERMLFRDGQGDVVPYLFKIEGDALELSLTGRLKNVTKLKRK